MCWLSCGALVLGVAGARLPSFAQEPQIVPPLAFASWPLQANSLICCPSSPTTCVKSADCKNGRRKGATSKKRQKSSKSDKKFFDTFRHFSRRAPFLRPLLGALVKIGDGPNTVSKSSASNNELSEFLSLTEFRGRNSVSSSRPSIRVPK